MAKRDFTEMEAALIPLGFEHQGNGFFYSAVAGRSFDFSACSLEGGRGQDIRGRSGGWQKIFERPNQGNYGGLSHVHHLRSEN